jgi:hypothetical protein
MNWIIYLFIKFGLVEKINYNNNLITSEVHLVGNKSFVPSHP